MPRSTRPSSSGRALRIAARPAIVLVYGAGSGLGKSKLAAALARALRERGRTVELLREESVLDEAAFAPYVERVRAGRGDDMDTLLGCCEQFAERMAASGSDVIVLDSLLPCWDWLVSAGCPDDRIADFTRALTHALEGIPSALVLVGGDLDQALARAERDRGEAWARDLAARRTGSADPAALPSYFGELRAGTERALPHWKSPVLRVDTCALELSAARERTLAWISRHLLLERVGVSRDR